VFLCIITADVLCCTILYYSHVVEGCHGKQAVGIDIARGGTEYIQRHNRLWNKLCKIQNTWKYYNTKYFKDFI